MCERFSPGRRDFTSEPLQGPVAAAYDRRRHIGQRDDRSDLGALPDELERRDVALDAVVVRGQRGRAHQLDRAVLADEPTARTGRPCEYGQAGRDRGDCQETPFHRHPPRVGEKPGRCRYSPVRASWTSLRQLGFPGRCLNLSTRWAGNVRPVAPRPSTVRVARARAGPPWSLRADERRCG